MKEHSAEHAPVYAADYPSNPFTTALTGAKLLWQNGKSVLPGVATVQFFAILLAVIFFALAVVGAAMLLLTWFVQATSAGQLDAETANAVNAVIGQLPAEFITLANTSAYLPVTGGAMAIIGMVGATLGITFVQALEYSLTASTLARRHKAKFGPTMGLAFRRMWPLLWQGSLVGAAVLTLLVVPGVIFALLSTLSPLFTGLAGLFYLSLIGFLIYAGLRLVMAGPAVVIDSMGAIAALKYSWRITNHKVGEILGIFAVITAANTVLTIVFDVLSAATISLPAVSATIDFLAFVIVVLFSLATTAAVIERYVQLVSSDKTNLKSHTTDWNSNIAAIGVMVGLSLLSGLVESTVSPAQPVLPEQPTVPEASDLQST